jgi:hypothetical protein
MVKFAGQQSDGFRALASPLQAASRLAVNGRWCFAISATHYMPSLAATGYQPF